MIKENVDKLLNFVGLARQLYMQTPQYQHEYEQKLLKQDVENAAQVYSSKINEMTAATGKLGDVIRPLIGKPLTQEDLTNIEAARDVLEQTQKEEQMAGQRYTSLRFEAGETEDLYERKLEIAKGAIATRDTLSQVDNILAYAANQRAEDLRAAKIARKNTTRKFYQQIAKDELPDISTFDNKEEK